MRRQSLKCFVPARRIANQSYVCGGDFLPYDATHGSLLTWCYLWEELGAATKTATRVCQKKGKFLFWKNQLTSLPSSLVPSRHGSSMFSWHLFLRIYADQRCLKRLASTSVAQRPNGPERSHYDFLPRQQGGQTSVNPCPWRWDLERISFASGGK